MDKLYSLAELGWDSFFDNQLAKKSLQNQIGRISSTHYNSYTILCEYGTYQASLSGKIRHDIDRCTIEKPGVGDWVVFSPQKESTRSIISTILKHKSVMYRRGCDKKTEKQMIAANIDYIFIMTGLDRDFNLRRIERYLTLSWESGAAPVILFNKCDLINPEELNNLMFSIEANFPVVPIYALSVLYTTGLDFLSQYLKTGKTVAIVGSSGCGKSSLTNYIVGSSVQKTGSVREKDRRGKHVTSARRMFILKQGGILIDNPGLREIQLYAGKETVAQTFGEIETLAKECKFNDCTHQGEPGCAVQDALLTGAINHERFISYLKQQKEILYLEKDRYYKEKIVQKRISKLIKSHKMTSYKYR